MLQQPTPDDYVIATGETHAVRELCEIAFARVGLDWEKHVVVDPKLVRPAEVDLLQGDASKAKRVLGWQPRVSFRQRLKMMLDPDLGWHGVQRGRSNLRSNTRDVEVAR